uniref:PHD-type domain-containing protein n=1 Tax=Corethron hystrix TaxID=216773 RepID=A0A7S1B414_9STRA|mmetsp:Transcript_12096/g.26481  ORF Transcript_12096/g.26481 Transcript_12096/m.26481 type:complete len:192 (+) Transcript_12096:243-818(+)
MSLASSGGGSSGNASASKKSRSVPKCDICAMKDGVVGKRMLTCSVCGVHVHGECYGEAEETIRRRSSRWTCHACGWVRASPGRTRPRKCVLCSVDHGVHAMHPLYDTYGKRGKHATLPNGELAWVHSLCAVMIGSSALMKGCVFACDKKGRYDGDEEDSDEEDSDKEEEEEEEAPQLEWSGGTGRQQCPGL